MQAGLHISILGMGLYMFLRKTGMPLWIAALVAGIFLLFYGIMTGMSVSAKRSIYMFIMKLAADSICRTVDKPTSFAFIAVLILIPQPSIMCECSYLLSFGSAAGIYFLAPVISSQFRAALLRSRKISLWIKTHKKTKVYAAISGLTGSLIMSISVTFTILPVTLWFFYEYPVWSIFLNLIVLPLMTLLVVSAFLAMLLPGTGILGTPAYLILKFFEFVCSLFDKLPFHNWNPGRPQVWAIVIYYVIWLVVVLYPKCCHKSRFVMLCKPKLHLLKLCKLQHVFILLFLSPLLFVFPKLPKNTLIMMDVGQGDGLVYYSDSRDVYLIDGGSSSKPNVGRYVMKNTLKRFGLSHIDAAFVSHPDTDHCSGLIEIMENRDIWGFDIDEVVLPGCVETDSGLHNFEVISALATASDYKEDICIYYVCAGDKWKSGRNEFSCLHPSKDFAAKDPNEMSECFYLRFFEDSDISLLLTGDVQGEGEKALTEIMRKLDLDATLLKVAHHGSKYSSLEKFLSVANPQVALISAGKKNRYGHPHKEVIERLLVQNCEILNTQESGNICITVRKNGIVCRSY